MSFAGGGGGIEFVGRIDLDTNPFHQKMQAAAAEVKAFGQGFGTALSTATTTHGTAFLGQVTKLNTGLSGLGRTTNALSGSFDRLGRSITGLGIGAFVGSIYAMERALSRGIEKAREFQTATLAIAAGIQSSNQITGASGTQYSGGKANQTNLELGYQRALGEARRINSILIERSNKNILTYEEQLKAFQVSTPIAAKKGLTQDQQVKLSEQVAEAAKLVGLEGQNITNQVRVALSGRNVPRSVLGSILGLDSNAIRSLQGDQYFKYFQDKLRGLTGGAGEFGKSIEATLSTLQSKASLFLARVGEKVINRSSGDIASLGDMLDPESKSGKQLSDKLAKIFENVIKAFETLAHSPAIPLIQNFLEFLANYGDRLLIIGALSKVIGLVAGLNARLVMTRDLLTQTFGGGARVGGEEGGGMPGIRGPRTSAGMLLGAESTLGSGLAGSRWEGGVIGVRGRFGPSSMVRDPGYMPASAEQVALGMGLGPAFTQNPFGIRSGRMSSAATAQAAARMAEEAQASRAAMISAEMSRRDTAIAAARVFGVNGDMTNVPYGKFSNVEALQPKRFLLDARKNGLASALGGQFGGATRAKIGSFLFGAPGDPENGVAPTVGLATKAMRGLQAGAGAYFGAQLLSNLTGEDPEKGGFFSNVAAPVGTGAAFGFQVGGPWGALLGGAAGGALVAKNWLDEPFAKAKAQQDEDAETNRRINSRNPLLARAIQLNQTLTDPGLSISEKSKAAIRKEISHLEDAAAAAISSEKREADYKAYATSLKVQLPFAKMLFGSQGSSMTSMIESKLARAQIEEARIAGTLPYTAAGDHEAALAAVRQARTTIIDDDTGRRRPLRAGDNGFMTFEDMRQNGASEDLKRQSDAAQSFDLRRNLLKPQELMAKASENDFSSGLLALRGKLLGDRTSFGFDAAGSKQFESYRQTSINKFMEDFGDKLKDAARSLQDLSHESYRLKESLNDQRAAADITLRKASFDYLKLPADLDKDMFSYKKVKKMGSARGALFKDQAPVYEDANSIDDAIESANKEAAKLALSQWYARKFGSTRQNIGSIGGKPVFDTASESEMKNAYLNDVQQGARQNAFDKISQGGIDMRDAGRKRQDFEFDIAKKGQELAKKLADATEEFARLSKDFAGRSKLLIAAAKDFKIDPVKISAQIKATANVSINVNGVITKQAFQEEVGAAIQKIMPSALDQLLLKLNLQESRDKKRMNDLLNPGRT